MNKDDFARRKEKDLDKKEREVDKREKRKCYEDDNKKPKK